MSRTFRPALLVLLALLGCRQEDAGGFQGYVDAEYLRIAAPEAGWLTGIAVAKGQRVAAGAPLFTLDATREEAAVNEARASLAQAQSQLADREKGARPEEIASIEAQLAEAEAAVVLARQTLERQQVLVRTRVVSQAQLDDARAATDQAEARRNRIRADLAVARLPARADQVSAARAAVEVAQGALAQAEWQLAQRRVASPATGLVDDVLRRPGEWVPASGVVVSLLPPDATKVVFFVPEARRAALHQGDRVAIACTGCPDGLSGRISRIASEAEYTPPVIYSRETSAKLIWRMEAVIAQVPGAPTPGQPVTVRAAP